MAPRSSAAIVEPNRSPAVMQQRREDRDSLDFFPTPPWATRALCGALMQRGNNLERQTCWEPAAGNGDMVRPLAEAFDVVFGSDVHDWSGGKFALTDFLWPESHFPFDWIITNPPFRLADQFAETAIERARVGAAMLVRTAFLEGKERYRFFTRHRPSLILQFSERVVMLRGKLSPDGSSATAYCWIVWQKRDLSGTTRFDWIPPCRRFFERKEDYT